METKHCSKCDQEKSLSDFYKRSKGNSYHSACKICEREMAKDWYQRNRESAKEKYRHWREKNPETIKRYRKENRAKHYRQEVMRKYGVDEHWFDEQMQRQGGACQCCKREFAWGDKQKSPHVDHCHKTSKVRGILCNRCNTVLGLCRDDPDLLSTLAGYLRTCHGYSAEH